MTCLIFNSINTEYSYQGKTCWYPFPCSFRTWPIATSLTGVEIVMGTPMAAVAAFSGAVSTDLAGINKKLERKVNKHTKIHALAVAKHDTINSYVSKIALQ